MQANEAVVNQSMWVVSAHSADFVWRAGGAIALHRKNGYRVKVVCLAFGERGVQAKRNIGIKASRHIEYAEGYQRITPQVVGDLS